MPALLPASCSRSRCFRRRCADLDTCPSFSFLRWEASEDLVFFPGAGIAQTLRAMSTNAGSKKRKTSNVEECYSCDSDYEGLGGRGPGEGETGSTRRPLACIRGMEGERVMDALLAAR